jgi:hypothetical protein
MDTSLMALPFYAILGGWETRVLACIKKRNLLRAGSPKQVL